MAVAAEAKSQKHKHQAELERLVDAQGGVCSRCSLAGKHYVRRHADAAVETADVVASADERERRESTLLVQLRTDSVPYEAWCVDCWWRHHRRAQRHAAPAAHVEWNRRRDAVLDELKRKRGSCSACRRRVLDRPILPLAFFRFQPWDAQVRERMLELGVPVSGEPDPAELRRVFGMCRLMCSIPCGQEARQARNARDKKAVLDHNKAESTYARLLVKYATFLDQHGGKRPPEIAAEAIADPAMRQQHLACMATLHEAMQAEDMWWHWNRAQPMWEIPSLVRYAIPALVMHDLYVSRLAVWLANGAHGPIPCAEDRPWLRPYVHRWSSGNRRVLDMHADAFAIAEELMQSGTVKSAKHIHHTVDPATVSALIADLEPQTWLILRKAEHVIGFQKNAAGTYVQPQLNPTSSTTTTTTVAVPGGCREPFIVLSPEGLARGCVVRNCSTCGLPFPWDRSGATVCAYCERANQERWTLTNAERIIIDRQVLAMQRPNACAHCCVASENGRYDRAHMGRSFKARASGRGRGGSHPLEFRELDGDEYVNELRKCRLMCHACHVLETQMENTVLAQHRECLRVLDNHVMMRRLGDRPSSISGGGGGGDGKGVEAAITLPIQHVEETYVRRLAKYAHYVNVHGRSCGPSVHELRRLWDAMGNVDGADLAETDAVRARYTNDMAWLEHYVEQERKWWVYGRDHARLDQLAMVLHCRVPAVIARDVYLAGMLARIRTYLEPLADGKPHVVRGRMALPPRLLETWIRPELDVVDSTPDASRIRFDPHSPVYRAADRVMLNRVTEGSRLDDESACAKMLAVDPRSWWTLVDGEYPLVGLRQVTDSPKTNKAKKETKEKKETKKKKEKKAKKENPPRRSDAKWIQRPLPQWYRKRSRSVDMAGAEAEGEAEGHTKKYKLGSRASDSSDEDQDPGESGGGGGGDRGRDAKDKAMMRRGRASGEHKWTAADDRQLEKAHHDGISMDAIATLMRRSKADIHRRLAWQLQQTAEMESKGTGTPTKLKPTAHGGPWTMGDDIRLMEWAAKEVSIDEIAARLKRTPISIHYRLANLQKNGT